MAIKKEIGAYSAYAIAKKHGFDGTEEEWLASLVGPRGAQGASVTGVKIDSNEHIIITIHDPATNTDTAIDAGPIDNTSAVQSIQQAAQAAITQVTQAQTAGVNAVNSARDTALQQVQASTEAAQTAATTATEAASAAASSATAANQSKTDAESSKTAAEAAKTAAASSASAAAGSATSAQTYATTAQQAAETATSAAETAAEDAASAVSEQLKEDVQDIVDNLDGLSEAIAIKETASGEVVSVADSAAAKLRGLRIYGKSGQATTTGAQLLDIREEIASYGTSITATTDGTGGVTINGTAGSEGQADIYLVGSWDSPEVLFEEDTYTFSVDGLSADETLYVINNQSVVKQNIGTGSCTVTSQITGLSIRLKADKTYSNFKIYPMLSAGSSAKPWEPYSGGKPSPSPEYPQEIESAGDSGNITVTLSDGGDKVQTLTYPTPNGLPGIPVDSGGNYTDVDGQQWICDEVDFGRGKYVQRVKKEELTGTPNFNVTADIDAERFRWDSCLTNIYKDGSNSSLSNFASFRRWSTGTSNPPIFAISGKDVYFKPTASTTKEEINALFTQMIASENPPYIVGQLEIPVETDLTPEQITAYAALTTYKPNTTIMTDSDPAAGIEVNYVADTKTYIDNKLAAISEAILGGTTNGNV